MVRTKVESCETKSSGHDAQENLHICCRLARQFMRKEGIATPEGKWFEERT